MSTFPGVAQLVGRLVWDQDAASSSLATRTTVRPSAAAGVRTLFLMARLEPFKWNCPVDSSLPPARWRQLLNFTSLATRTPRSSGVAAFVSLWRDSNHLNGTVQRTVPWRQLDGANSLIYRVSPLGHPEAAGVAFVSFWRDANHLNGTVRRTVPWHQLDGANSFILRVSPLGHPRSSGGSDFVSYGETRTI